MKPRKANKKTVRRKQRGGICPCVYQSILKGNKKQNGGVVATLITQFNNAASLLTPIGAAFGIKAYRSWKKNRRTRKRV